MGIQEVWSRLGLIHELAFNSVSRSKTKTGWNGIGQGTVSVEVIDPTTILFHESGTWIPEGGRELKFTNIFRWALNLNPEYLQLEHLRLGPQNPVYLFHLVSKIEGRFESAEPHVCRDELYTATMEITSEELMLDWTITGPEMNEKISYTYC